MTLEQELAEVPLARESAVTIGVFDGVHLGHQAVFRHLLEKARELGLPATVITFEPQPQEFFSPHAAPARLTRFREKLQAIRDSGVDRVMLLEWGADDYVVKPFGFRELVARVRAVLRRAGGGSGPTGTTRTVGPLTVDTRTRRVTFDDADVALTPKEFDLLAFLLEDPGAVVTREEIIRSIWDENWWGPTKTLDVHIASLRKKLAPGLIETVRGVGFRVVEPPA